MAYGVAAFAWGGKNQKDLPSWSLSAADFPVTREEGFDSYVMPADLKLEGRPRAPHSVAVWKRQCENEIEVWCHTMGQEHREERLLALQTLEKAHEEDDNVFPSHYIMDLWEELWSVWCEEVREGRRALQRLLDTDHPRKEDIKFVALTPGADGLPSWKFPTTFDLQAPDSYYQRVCMPRQERALKRILFAQLYRGPPKTPTKAGELGADSEGAGDQSRRAGGPDLKKGDKGSDPKKGDKAYQAGKRLPAWE